MVICNNCNKSMVKKQADLSFKDKHIGNYIVKSVEHFACEDCGDKLILANEAERIEKTHIIKFIEFKKNTNLIEIRNELKCDYTLLGNVVEELVKKKIVSMDLKQEVPTINLLTKKEDNKLIKVLKKLFKGE